MTRILNTKVIKDDHGKIKFENSYAVYRTLFLFTQTKHINHHLGAKLHGSDHVIIYCKHRCKRINPEHKQLLGQLIDNCAVKSVYDGYEALSYQQEIKELYGTESVDGETQCKHVSLWQRNKNRCGLG